MIVTSLLLLEGLKPIVTVSSETSLKGAKAPTVTVDQIINNINAISISHEESIVERNERIVDDLIADRNKPLVSPKTPAEFAAEKDIKSQIAEFRRKQSIAAKAIEARVKNTKAAPGSVGMSWLGSTASANPYLIGSKVLIPKKPKAVQPPKAPVGFTHHGAQIVLTNHGLFPLWRKHVGELMWDVKSATLEEAIAFAVRYSLDLAGLIQRIPVSPVSNWGFFTTFSGRVVHSDIHIIAEQSGRVMKCKYSSGKTGPVLDNCLNEVVKYKLTAIYAKHKEGYKLQLVPIKKKGKKA